MTIIDAVDALSVVALTQAGVADDMGTPEPGLDPVVVDMDPQPLADQTGGRGS